MYVAWMGDARLDARLRESEAELKRLLQAVTALGVLVTDRRPDPAHAHCLAEELRSARREAEGVLRDLQERVDLNVDELGDDGAAWKRESGILSRATKQRAGRG